MAPVNDLATWWAWRWLVSLSAVAGAKLAGALGAVGVAAGELALAAGTGPTVVVVPFTLARPEEAGANVVGGNVVGGSVDCGSGGTAVLGTECPRWPLGPP
jgi:hypothetical protein